jgi:hypothetical protein
MIISEESKLILDSLRKLLNQLSDEEYVRSLPILSNSSLSQHVRHILEFYQEFLLGIRNDLVDFDARKRSHRIEIDKNFALEFIFFLIRELELIKSDSPISIKVSTHENNNRPVLQSSVFRELAYCNEHSVHHMAILKIGIYSEFPHIQVSKGFGVAFSTQFANQSTGYC